MAPGDPILGVTEAFVADQNPKKVNLGVGVYYDDNGKVPLLECVKRAEKLRLDTSPNRGYLPIDGLAAYDRAVQELVFGAGSAAVRDKRVVTVQALGGTGGGVSTPARKSGSATRAGRTTGSCSRRRASRSTPTRTTTPRRTA